MESFEALLAFLEGAAVNLDGDLLLFDLGGEFGEAGFEAGAFLFEADFFGGEFFEANGVALFLEFEGGEFVADAGERLGGGEGAGLGFAEFVLFFGELTFDGAEGDLFFLEGDASGGERLVGSGDAGDDGGEFGFGGGALFGGAGEVGDAAVLLFVGFGEAFLIDADAIFVAIAFRF